MASTGDSSAKGSPWRQSRVSPMRLKAGFAEWGWRLRSWGRSHSGSSLKRRRLAIGKIAGAVRTVAGILIRTRRWNLRSPGDDCTSELWTL